MNINSLHNKINDLRKINTHINLIHKHTYYVLMKPKLMNRSQMLSFTFRATSILLLEKIAIKWWWKIVYVKEGLIAKRILEYDNINIEILKLFA